MRTVWLGLITTIFIVYSAAGQSRFFQLSGKVTDLEGKPLPGATIFVHELNNGVSAKSDGSYEVYSLRSGSYHIHVTFIGYEAVTRTIKIENQDLTQNFTLHTSSVELKEIIVEANPFKSGPVEQSMTVNVIERKFLEKSSSNSFVNALQKIPGVSAINTGVGIAKPVIRGMSFNRVIVNDRGIKQEGQQWGADHGLEIDQYEPERVEIIKGPASLLYGSDAMGGVINIQAPSLPENNSLTGSVLGVYKSNNDLYGTSTMIQGNANGLVFRGRFSSQDFADYKVPADSFKYNRYVLPVYNNSLKNTAGNERNFTGMVGIKRSWGYSTLTVSNFHQKAGMFPGAFGVPRSYQLLPDGDERNIGKPRQVINHFKTIWNSNILFGSNWLEVDLGYQNNYRREESLPHTHGIIGFIPATDLTLGLKLQTWSGNIRYYTSSEKIKNIYAIQFQYQENNKSGYEHLLPNFTSANAGAFVYKELQINTNTTVNGGIRFDYGARNINRTIQPNPYTENPLDSLERNRLIATNFYNFSGAAGISYYPNNNLNIKLNAGSSFRMPTSAELSSNGIHHGTFRHEVGNKDLKTERGGQIDLNISYHKSDFYLNLTPFISYYNDYIYLAPMAEFSELPEGAQKYAYRQHNAIFTGGEINVDLHLLRELHVGSSIEYVYNYNMETNLPLPFTPPFSVLTEVDYSFPFKSKVFSDMTIGANLQRFAAQNRVDRNEPPTEGYTLIEANVKLQLNWNKQPFMFTFSAQNLLDESYLNHLSRYRIINLPEQGRNFSVQLKIPLKIK